MTIRAETLLTPRATLDAMMPAIAGSGMLDAAAPSQGSASSSLLGAGAQSLTRLDVFNGYLGAFIAAFVVTLVATPVMRWLATTNGVVDIPENDRKIHRAPVAYLGGVAVYLGLLAAIAYATIAPRFPAIFLFEPHHSELAQRQSSLFVVLAGMTAVMLAGLLDDVIGVSPRVKIAGLLFAAAFLAFADIGVRVAQGVLGPIGSFVGNPELAWDVVLPFIGLSVHVDLIYWAGTVIIALFVLGACNASNLLDGLDGLLTGVTSIASAGLLVVALGLAVVDDGPLDSARVVLCMGLLGATLGFLPFNFKPATIFLGDAGSLLLGFVTIVIVLSLGDTGKTFFVVAGLLIYALPIIDTSLAIVRRRLSHQPIFSADNHHLHHMLERRLGVVGAVFSLYGIGVAFAVLGVLTSLGRARISYAIALVLASYIAVTAVKMARKRLREERDPAALTKSDHPVGPPANGAKGAASFASRASADQPQPKDRDPAAPRLI